MEDIFFGIPATDWAEILRNYGLLLASGATVWIAHNGLEAWKQQKLWESNRELAHDTILCLFKLGQETIISRSLQLTGTPIELVNELSQNPSVDIKASAKSVVESINRSLPKLENLCKEFEICLAKTTIIWDDKKLSTLASEVLFMSRDLIVSLSVFRDALLDDDNSDDFVATHLERLTCKTIKGGDESEAFEKNFMDKINLLRSRITPYIGRSS